MIEYLWLLENRCNYGCPYCSYSVEASRAPLVALQNQGVAAEQWEKAWDRAEPGWIYITGAGEPTLHPDFARLVLHISRRHRLSFDTNLSWSLEALSRFLARADRERVKIEMSFHPSDMELKDFIAKADMVKRAGFEYQCRWVAYPAHFERIEEYGARFAEAGLLFTVTPYKGDGYPAAYTPLQRDAILSAARAPGAPTGQIAHLLNQDAERPEGRLCRSGKDYAAIMPDGKAYRCQQYGMRGWEPLGDFLSEGFSLAAGAKPCRSESCGHEYRWLVAHTDCVRTQSPYNAEVSRA